MEAVAGSTTETKRKLVLSMKKVSSPFSVLFPAPTESVLPVPRIRRRDVLVASKYHRAFDSIVLGALNRVRPTEIIVSSLSESFLVFSLTKGPSTRIGSGPNLQDQK